MLATQRTRQSGRRQHACVPEDGLAAVCHWQYIFTGVNAQSMPHNAAVRASFLEAYRDKMLTFNVLDEA